MNVHANGEWKSRYELMFSFVRGFRLDRRGRRPVADRCAERRSWGATAIVLADQGLYIYKLTK